MVVERLNKNIFKKRNRIDDFIKINIINKKKLYIRKNINIYEKEKFKIGYLYLYEDSQLNQELHL